MKVTCWLRITRTGSVTVTKRPPSLASRNVVAVKVVLDVPDALYRAPILSAAVTVDPTQVVEIAVPVEVPEVFATHDEAEPVAPADTEAGS